MNKIMSGIAALALGAHSLAAQAAAPAPEAVLEHYADIAQAVYQDSLTTAQGLQAAVDKLLAEPTETNLAAARASWVAARHPYQQSEAFRFGNAIVDDWEGKVNAWPLDEGLIDYVAASYGSESDENPYYTANVIANPTLKLSGKIIDARTIDKKLLAETLHEVDEVETNVATGYHAIEFLLWGQDLNGTAPGAGQRPASDFDTKHCTAGHCDRRGAYLKAATELLVDDLAWMAAQWAPGGQARTDLNKAGDKALATIFTGMGSLSYGELAGERMKLGVMLHDPEEEHDCFSDNTHWSHYNDALGIRNVYTGTYVRVDGSKLSGPSLSELIAATDPATDRELRERLNATVARMQVLVDSAEKEGVAYDQLLAEGNDAGNAMVMAAVDALVAQAKSIEKAVGVMKLEGVAFEGSDSLDAPHKVGK